MSEMVVRGKSVVVAATDTTLYTVGGVADAREAEITVKVTNTGGTPRTFRLGVRPLAAAIVAGDYEAYDMPLPAGEGMRFPLALLATDIVLVRADHADVTFRYDGVERTRTLL